MADLRGAALARVAGRYGVAGARADLSDPDAVRTLAAGTTWCSAPAERIGFQTLRAVIEAGRDYVDISFMPENALRARRAWRGAGVTAVVDCGVAPGMSNMMAGYAAAASTPASDVEIYVGGLPVRAPLAVRLQGGLRAARRDRGVRAPRAHRGARPGGREGGALRARAAWTSRASARWRRSTPTGCAACVYTLTAPFMKEKTLRYPGPRRR